MSNRDIVGPTRRREIARLEAQLQIAREALEEIRDNSTCELSQVVAEQALDRMEDK
jgi:hypothetical protein